jgi:superoxide dismutase, Cu-Zn family
MRSLKLLAIALAFSTTLSAAEGGAGSAPATPPQAAIAVIQATAGNKVSGTVRFTQRDHGVAVTADLAGLSPGKHGFHIHELGDASSKDGSAAGGHFNPSGAPHGGHESPKHHSGDLGNIEAGADGNARLELTVEGISITGGDGIVGRSVVVHEKADDLTTQPSGNSGARIGVGIIGLAK